MAEDTSKKTVSVWVKVLIGVFVLGLIGRLVSPVSDQTNANATAKSLEEKDRALADTLLNIRVVSERYLKKNLKDPETFEVIEHSEYRVNVPEPDVHYQASVRYRAKNSFGGFVIEKKCFNYSIKGALVKVFDCY